MIKALQLFITHVKAKYYIYNYGLVLYVLITLIVGYLINFKPIIMAVLMSGVLLLIVLKNFFRLTIRQGILTFSDKNIIFIYNNKYELKLSLNEIELISFYYFGYHCFLETLRSKQVEGEVNKLIIKSINQRKKIYYVEIENYAQLKELKDYLKYLKNEIGINVTFKKFIAFSYYKRKI